MGQRWRAGEHTKIHQQLHGDTITTDEFFRRALAIIREFPGFYLSDIYPEEYPETGPWARTDAGKLAGARLEHSMPSTPEPAKTDSEEIERRRRALAAADASNRIEGFERSAETAPLFEQWVRGELTDDELRQRLREFYRDWEK